MPRSRPFLGATIRWGWFAILVLAAFGYLASGLSNVSSNPNQSESSTPELVVSGQLKSIVNKVDQQWQANLTANQLEAAPIADWMTICRRMSLAMVGSGLSLEEIRKLEQYPEDQREQIHLNTLLNDSRFHHYWAERWARFLVGTDGGQFITYRRRRFRIWLSEQFADNRPYDEMATDLITAGGLWTDKPQVNFITATFDSNDGNPDPIRLAARTSRAFLGLRIDCLQCHNDFLGNVNLGDPNNPREGMQKDFHQLAAFYSSAKSNGLQGIRSGKVEYQYKYLDDEEETTVEAAVPFYPELLPRDGEPRTRLAKWITHPENHQASRAAVSHVWALMFGRAAGDSVDNLPLDEDVGPVIDALAKDFVDHGFDLRRLISVIVHSASFRVDSVASFEITNRHEDLGAVFPMVRLRPEQVAGTMIQAARIKKTDRESSAFLQLQTLTGTNDFVTRYGDPGEDEFADDNVTITQRLLMMNGNLLRELENPNPIVNTTSHVNMFAKDDASAIDSIFLCTLNRLPTAAQKSRFLSRFKQANNRSEAIEDLFWVLLNTSEAAWNH